MHGDVRSSAPATPEPRGPVRRRRRVAGGGTLAFVESPVQLLNVLEWAYRETAAERDPEPDGSDPEADPVPESDSGSEPDLDSGAVPESRPGPDSGACSLPEGLTVVVLSPHDPMTRGQLRRVAEFARAEGVAVRWEDAREGTLAPVRTVTSLAPELRRARRIVIGDPFSRYVQLLLTLSSARSVVVVDDGTATMEFVHQLARGERLMRWHQGGTGGARAALFLLFSRRARDRLTPGARDGEHRVEVFSAMPVEATTAELAALGVTVTANRFSWTRARFGPPRLTRGTDLVGTSLVETGVVDLERYLEAVAALARTHGATRYFAHRRENGDKLHRVAAATGLEIVRPDLPLELVARRGPVGRTILSFPSTVVHTLPLALAGTEVSVAVCEVRADWLTESASPRAEGFLSGVSGSARGVRRLPPPVPEPVPGPVPERAQEAAAGGELRAPGETGEARGGGVAASGTGAASA